MKISKNWTLEERVAVITQILLQIQLDIPAGYYGWYGRPNIQSVLLILSEPKEVLESYRQQCEEIVKDI